MPIPEQCPERQKDKFVMGPEVRVTWSPENSWGGERGRLGGMKGGLRHMSRKKIK